MNSMKLFLAIALVAALSATTNAGILDALIPRVLTEFYSLEPAEESYRFKLEEPNGSKREEVGMLLNPGQENQELVVMGTYSSVDEKTDIETITMYTADKNGYRPRYEIKNRKLSPGALKSAAG